VPEPPRLLYGLPLEQPPQLGRRFFRLHHTLIPIDIRVQIRPDEPRMQHTHRDVPVFQVDGEILENTVHSRLARAVRVVPAGRVIRHRAHARRHDGDMSRLIGGQDVVEKSLRQEEWSERVDRERGLEGLEVDGAEGVGGMGWHYSSNVEQDIDLPIADRLLEFPDRFERRDVQTADLAFGPVKTRELLAGRGVERVDEIVLECVSVSVGRDGTVNVTKVAQKGGGAEFKSAS